MQLIPLKVHKSHTYIKHPFSQHAAAVKVKNHIKYPEGGLLNKILYREALPKGPTPYVFYTIIDRTGNH